MLSPDLQGTRAGQVVTRTHQRLIDLAIDTLQDDDYSGLPDLETDDDDQKVYMLSHNLRCKMMA
jgi:hypothetical protein